MRSFTRARINIVSDLTQTISEHGTKLLNDQFSLPLRSTQSSWSPTFPDQVRPTAWWGLYTTSFRPLLDGTRLPHDHSRLIHDINSTPTPISTRSSRPFTIPTRALLDQLDQLDFYSISIRPWLDQIVLAMLGSLEIINWACRENFDIKTWSSMI